MRPIPPMLDIANACAALLLAVLVASCSSTGPGRQPHAVPLISTRDLPAPAPGEVHLFAINDLHGHLLPVNGNDGRLATYDAGGAAYLAAHMARLKARYPDSAVVSAGDNVGASPLESSLFHDEPTIRFLDALTTAASAVGNHEFDHGVTELARLQAGGCASDGCEPGDPFTGATFPYLAANVTDQNGQQPPTLRPWTMLTVGGHRIGVVGVVTPDTAHIVAPAGIRGYTFSDEADAVNKAVPQLQAAGAETIVALIHDGGEQRTGSAPLDYNGCVGITDSVTALAQHTDSAVRVLITGHSHQPYNCSIGGKVVTQASSYGRLITDVTLRFHDARVDASAVNRLVSHDIAPDPAISRLVDFYAAQAQPRGARIIGSAAREVSSSPHAGGDSPLGNLIADAMLASTADDRTVAAFMNPGGLRADLAAGPISYAEAYRALPFGNQVVVVQLTGQQLLDMLEQQWTDPDRPRVLSVAGITYAYDHAAAKGHRILANTVRIGDQSLNPAASYQIATNNYLAAGGDRFSVLGHAAQTAVGPADLDALEAYLHAHPNITPPTSRVQRR